MASCSLVLRQIFKPSLLQKYKLYTMTARRSINSFNWEDPLNFESNLTEDEKLVRDSVNAYCQQELLPRVTADFRDETFSKDILIGLGSLGILGCMLDGYGMSGISNVTYGLITREIERVDSGYRSAVGVHETLAMGVIDMYGSEQQKKRYLPLMSKGTLIGCFALTEPNYGSDPGSLETHARYDSSSKTYWLNGSKTWITNAPIADIFIVWAKCDDQKIRGFIVNRQESVEGLSISKFQGKMSLRTCPTGKIVMDNLQIPEDNLLPKAIGLSCAFHHLNNARYGIAWGTLGASEACLQIARNYVMDRHQFGRPLAANQLIQKKLADMSTEIAIGLQACLHLGRLKDKDLYTSEMISMLKRNNVQKALLISRNARDMLGANGIQDEYHIIRHLLNLEGVSPYGGTDDIHALILGRSLTGFSSFN